MKCIICNRETEGSIGASGIKWRCICQPCKDIEDRALADSITHEARVYDFISTIGQKYLDKQTKL